MSSGLSEQRRDMNPPKKRLRTGDGGAETPRGEQQEEGSAVDVVGDELTDSQDNTELKRSTQQREQSIIMPVYNASCWLDECLQAILQQDFTGSMELSVYDDASTDDSRIVVEGWRERLEARGISVVTSSHNSAQPRGVGYAKNMAISQSCGKYLCFQDADDVMLPQRVRLQYEASLLHPNSLIGCRVQRLPEGSTERYTRWINTITQDQLITQGNHLEAASGLPAGESTQPMGELHHMERWETGPEVIPMPEPDQSEESMLPPHVKAFCDVDENKIRKGFYTYEESKEIPKPKIPILHYKDASAPFIICVKLDMTGGVLEENLNSLQLKEGTDYYHFN
ncbi:queuosine-tRNA galactosyltransferase isoform X5 [Trachinotus anak]|uniref:queuosine-tRNA galactosyltransferase isoform X5 n=1 Tax=Trachinotus anak TaxID=443729 RepID=UPI0039F16A23